MKFKEKREHSKYFLLQEAALSRAQQPCTILALPLTWGVHWQKAWEALPQTEPYAQTKQGEQNMCYQIWFTIQIYFNILFSSHSEKPSDNVIVL